jgi:hypothetical protein
MAHEAKVEESDPSIEITCAGPDYRDKKSPQFNGSIARCSTCWQIHQVNSSTSQEYGSHNTKDLRTNKPTNLTGRRPKQLRVAHSDV